MAKTDLTAERLREILHYDPETGVFTRRVRTRNNAQSGGIAGTTNADGYVCVRVDGARLLAHRLAWFYSTGAWPSGVIDHINGVTSDNRIRNLRDVSVSENSQNMRQGHADARVSYLGVSPRRNKWRASIFFNGKHISLGDFITPEEASAAYVAAKKVYHARAMSTH